MVLIISNVLGAKALIISMFLKLESIDEIFYLIYDIIFLFLDFRVSDNIKMNWYLSLV